MDLTGVLAVVSGGILETGLKAMLERCLVDDPALSSRFLGQNGSVGAFGAQVNLAYLIGLIGRDARDDLAKIAVIRNAFAHQPKGLAFSASPIREHCRDLRLPDHHTRDCGDNPAAALLIHSEHQGRVIQLGLDIGRRDERITEPRWRFEVTVQLLHFLLKRTSPRRPASISPSAAWET